MSYDLVVIGGGPAGYVGAIRAAQLGKKVACVEVERPGGTCLNWGCIPTKALLKSAEFYHQAKRAEEFGFTIGKIEFDFAKIMARSRGVADQMAKGIGTLFKNKKVDHIVGRGQITPDNKVIVTAPDGSKQTLETKNILLATGCTPKSLPGLKPDGKRVFTSRELLAVTEQPKSMIILGAGAIGVEFAHFLHILGTKVTVIEMMPRILPVEDDEISNHLGRVFKKNGLEVLTGTKVEKTEVTAKGVKVTALTEGDAAPKTYEAETLLVAIGVQANTEGLFAAGVAPETDRGFLKTNDRYQTTIPGVYGAGDIIGPPWLAHVASHEAIEAVEGIFVPGKKPKKVTVFPGCTYASPQVASIGLTERKAKEQGLKYKVGKFPYVASGRAVAVGEPEGFVKLIVGEPYGEILGAHIIGSEATELIAELGLAITLEATVDEIHSTIHAHPTLAEMVAEATLAAQGHPIHI